MSLPNVAIVVIQRERYSPTLGCLSQLLRVTRYPFHLIYVDGNSPPPIHDYLQRMAKRHFNLKLIRLDRHLRVNEARNYALAMLPEVDYVLFLDNDVLVEPGWLERLVNAATQEQADLVTPLVLEGPSQTEAQQVHIAGLQLSLVSQADGRRCLAQQQPLHHQPLPTWPLLRKVCDGTESHCFLVRRDRLATLRFDPLVDEPFGYLDLSLQLQQQGLKVVLEPGARVTFLNPRFDPRFEPSDLPLHCFRWNERSLQETRGYMVCKWNLNPKNSGLEGSYRWAIANRQLPFKRAVSLPWRWLLKGSKLSFCPLGLRDRLEQFLQRRPMPIQSTLVET